MDDLTTMLNQIMSNPESMRQIQAMAASLGLGGNGNESDTPQPTQQPALPPPPQTTANDPQNPGGIDISALNSLLSNLQQQPAANAPSPAPSFDLSSLASLLGNVQQPAPAPAQNPSFDLSSLASLFGNTRQQQASAQNTVPDVSSLAGLLGNLTGSNQQANNSGNASLAALTSLLNAGGAPAAHSGGLPNLDVGTIMKLTQALSSLQTSKANVDLLLALKSRLKDDRAKKIDDAIRVMQLVQFLPLIKESGLFGDIDKGLGGLVGGGGGLGGLGSLLGGVGNSIGGLLGGLGRR